MYLPLRLCQIHVNLVSGKEKLRASAVAMLKASSGKTSAIARSTVSLVGALVGDDLVRVRRFASGIVTRHDLPHTPRTRTHGKRRLSLLSLSLRRAIPSQPFNSSNEIKAKRSHQPLQLLPCQGHPLPILVVKMVRTTISPTSPNSNRRPSAARNNGGGAGDSKGHTQTASGAISAGTCIQCQRPGR